ncbi:MAG: hypothetical protein ACJA2W_003946 [Planctomycetota bacterium]|jgi:hypothetical protein
MAATMAMIVITIVSSISVNPDRFLFCMFNLTPSDPWNLIDR